MMLWSIHCSSHRPLDDQVEQIEPWREDSFPVHWFFLGAGGDLISVAPSQIASPPAALQKQDKCRQVDVVPSHNAMFD
jgi:hypothetical protein